VCFAEPRPESITIGAEDDQRRLLDPAGLRFSEFKIGGGRHSNGKGRCSVRHRLGETAR
jgi:hypothetical protein